MARRLDHLPRAALTPAGLDVRVAATVRARLLGLAGLASVAAGSGLLLQRTRSVHTCFMRFTIHLLWLDDEGRVLRIDRAVGPWKWRGCRRARYVLELSAEALPAVDLAGLRLRAPPAGPPG